MQFDFEKTKIYKAILFKEKVFKVLFFIFLIVFLIFLIEALFSQFRILPLTISSDEVLGWLFLSLAISFFSYPFILFKKNYLLKSDEDGDLKSVLKDIDSGKNINLAEYLTYDAATSIYKALVFTKRKSIDLSYNSIFLFLLENKRANFIFDRLLINKEKFRRSIEVIVDSQKKNLKKEDVGDFKNILLSALKIAEKRGNKKITYGSVFSAIVFLDKTLENLFFDYGAKKEDIVSVAMWEENYYKERFLGPSFLDNIKNVRGIADDWVFGYTPVLLNYAKNISVSDSSYGHIHALGRDVEISKMEEILISDGKNNVILVGEPGAGRENVILGFVKKVKKGSVNGILKYCRVMKLDMNLVISNTKDNSATVALLDKIFLECKNAGNIILVIDDFHNYIGEQEAEGVGSLDISAVITPYLQSDQFRLIAITDSYSYHSNIEKNSSVASMLETVLVEEPDEEMTILKLEDLVPYIEKKHGVFISYHAILAVVSDSESYIQGAPFPEKAISLLSEVISFVLSNKAYGKTITQDHVTEVVSRKTGIPLGRIGGEEKAKLLNMESLLHERIIGQEQGIKVLSEAMRRVRSGISERKKPIGTFLFLGPTGVGKTETAKALADIYFGSEKRMIRLDMTEYQDPDSISRLIGSVDKKTEAQFANKVRENPFSLILLDEFEKAHRDIADLFLQILDEGRLTDAYQKKVSFRNTIIIATSNAGAEFVREFILSGQNPEVLNEKLTEYLLREKVFRPEFLNRFDAIVVFKPLTEKEIKEVARHILFNLQIRLKDKGMKLNITDELLDKVAQIGYNPVFGAREMKRIIQEKIENQIAKDIIAGKYKYGSEIYIDPNTL